LLTSFAKGSWRELEVHDPLFRKIKTKYGVSLDGDTAFLEMASASGLQLLTKEERDPLKTSTYGTGEMILDAIDRGARKIIMGIGGSATNDGGMGAVEALGVYLYDSSGRRLKPVGENLSRIAHLDFASVQSALKEISFTLFCDVDNPLYGLHGAAHVFAPQKGASPSAVDLLDAGLRHLEEILQKHFRTSFNFPGAGAGGGFPAGLKAVANIEVVSGMKFISEFTGLEKSIADADLIITGEGQLDEQTLSGKVVKGVAGLAGTISQTGSGTRWEMFVDTFAD
jgi:glycerate kinase